MLKKLFIATSILLCASCAATTEDKTPQTDRGQLNSCMLSRAYDLKAADKLSAKDKWQTSREILSYCKNKLNLHNSDISETQSLNIVGSYIETIK
ncbi:MAG: hypothetical protein J6T72_00420 [Alphaproteobacteria bacterium]|nr:hypothetical protein [Alphaproteobacteria bacterium]